MVLHSVYPSVCGHIGIEVGMCSAWIYLGRAIKLPSKSIKKEDNTTIASVIERIDRILAAR
jgi:hypothetical protein